MGVESTEHRIGALTEAVKQLSNRVERMNDGVGKLHGRIDEILQRTVQRDEHLRLVHDVSKLRDNLSEKADQDDVDAIEDRVTELGETVSGQRVGSSWMRELLVFILGGGVVGGVLKIFKD